MNALSSSSRPLLLPALLLTVGMATVILSALGFQYIGGYIPCALCLLQRWPYYIGVPLGVLTALSAAMGAPPAVTRTLLALLGFTMVVSAGLGIYHAGVEWRFWEGPATCSTGVNAVASDTKSLLDDLSNQHGPSCTDATLRVLGLSFAGWNVIASVVLAAIAYWGIQRSRA